MVKKAGSKKWKVVSTSRLLYILYKHVRVYIWRKQYADARLYLFHTDCGPPKTMTRATMTVLPDVGEITYKTVYPLLSTATYTCETGSEYQDGEVSKTAECSVGGEWKPDLHNTDTCQSGSNKFIYALMCFACIYFVI